MNDPRDLSKYIGAKVSVFAPPHNRLKLRPKVVGAVFAGIALASALLATSRASPDRNGFRASPGTDTVATSNPGICEEPYNARTRLEFGHALFSQGKPEAAIRSYDQALARNRELGDEKMYMNLASCFGSTAQGDAASLIARHQLVKIQPRLSTLAMDKHYKTRWGAIQTLEKIGKVTRSDFVHAWMADLDSSDCEMRKRAIEQLGRAGDRQALRAIRDAKRKDAATKKGFLMFASSCLGGRPEEAERKILARN